MSGAFTVTLKPSFNIYDLILYGNKNVVLFVIETIEIKRVLTFMLIQWIR